MKEEIGNNKGEIIIYQSEDGKIKLDVRLEEKTVWLTIDQMAELYGKARSTINEHILNAYKENEIEEAKTMRKIGNSDFSTKPTNYYNLDVIISVGYRVKSIVGTRFRQWATERLAEYIIKGFTMDDERLKTSVDYDPRTDASKLFFKMVQNKLHYAAHGHTAAEVIYDRADADKPFMGLTSFKGELPCINDIKIAKNYLTAEELKILNNIVSGYFDFAETQALRHRPMYMEDYVRQLDNILSANGDELLEGAGSVSHEEAMDKALIEYRKFQVKTLSPVEQDYLESIKLIEKKTKKKGSKGGM